MCFFDVTFICLISQRNVVGTQKSLLNEYSKHVFKLMGKEINAILDAQTILFWIYVKLV